jgi:hypothetical protein
VVPARDQERVAVADRGRDVDLAVERVGPVDPEPALAVDAEVVDLLQRHLAVGVLVVLVGREGGPVPVRGEDLDGDEPIGLERIGGHEVGDLSGGRSASSHLDGDRFRGDVGGLEAAVGAGGGEGQLRGAIGGHPGLTSHREVHEVADP